MTMRTLITALVTLTLIATCVWCDEEQSGIRHRLDTLGEDAREVGGAVRNRLGELGEDAQELGQSIAGAVTGDHDSSDSSGETTVVESTPTESVQEEAAQEESVQEELVAEETSTDEVVAQESPADEDSAQENMTQETASAESAIEEESPAPAGKELALTVLNSLRDHVATTMTRGYSGRLISEEQIDGEMLRKDLSVYFRVNPRAVRIEFHSPDDGQVVIWQQGWDSMLVDRPWLPQLSIDPSGARAMATSHRPVPTFGIDLTLDRYIAAIEAAAENDDVTCVEGGREQRGRQELIRYDFTHPAVSDSPVTTFTIWLDPETAIPIHFENRTADDTVYERYRYIEFSLNPPMNNDLFEE